GWSGARRRDDDRAPSADPSPLRRLARSVRACWRRQGDAVRVTGDLAGGRQVTGGKTRAARHARQDTGDKTRATRDTSRRGRKTLGDEDARHWPPSDPRGSIAR